jgi:hypothetical protein
MDATKAGGITTLAIEVKRKKPLYNNIQRLFYFCSANLTWCYIQFELRITPTAIPSILKG